MTPPHLSALHLVSTNTTAETHTGHDCVQPARSSASPPLPTPAQLRARHCLSEQARERIAHVRRELCARVEQGTGAPFVIVGPCSIHCEIAALEYAERLRHLQDELGERVTLVMRVYFEKPRTTVGWKGFLYDPDLDGSDDLGRGLERGRALMVKIAELGVPIATEILDPLAAAYLEDCLSWVAIGARTTESQIHRQLASSLCCPVGFKNGTDGGVQVAAQAIEAAAQPHTHLGLDDDGRVAVRRTCGNAATHIVLRGGRAGPNYDEQSVAECGMLLRRNKQQTALVVDCSHGNSEKDYRRQPDVFRSVVAQMRGGNRDLVGLMLESHLVAGKQSVSDNRAYGVSITDGCIDFPTTEALLHELAAELA